MEPITGHDAAVASSYNKTNGGADSKAVDESTPKKKKQILTKSLLVLSPDNKKFVTVLELHKAGIKVEREDIRAHQTTVTVLKDKAREKFDEKEDAEADVLQQEAVDLKKSYMKHLQKYNSAVHVLQLAKMAMEKQLGLEDFTIAGQCRDIFCSGRGHYMPCR